MALHDGRYEEAISTRSAIDGPLDASSWVRAYLMLGAGYCLARAGGGKVGRLRPRHDRRATCTRNHRSGAGQEPRRLLEDRDGICGDPAGVREKSSRQRAARKRPAARWLGLAVAAMPRMYDKCERVPMNRWRSSRRRGAMQSPMVQAEYGDALPATSASERRLRRNGMIIIFSMTTALALVTASECQSITHLPSLIYGFVLWGWWGCISGLAMETRGTDTCGVELFL